MSSPHSPDSRLAYFLIICTFVILWLAFGHPAHGQTSSSESLSNSEAMLEELIARLELRSQQAQKLQADLLEMQSLLDESLKRYALLEESWGNYRADVERQMACDHIWKWALAGTTALGVLAAFIFAMK